jgi:hypothetical protein
MFPVNPLMPAALIVKACVPPAVTTGGLALL